MLSMVSVAVMVGRRRRRIVVIVSLTTGSGTLSSTISAGGSAE